MRTRFCTGLRGCLLDDVTPSSRTWRHAASEHGISGIPSACFTRLSPLGCPLLSWDNVDAPVDAPGTYSPESALVSCVPLPSRSSWPSSGFPTTRGGLLSSSSNRWWRSRLRSCPQTSSPKSLLTLPHSGKRAHLPEARVKADGVLLTSSIGFIHVPTSTPSVDGVYPVAKQQRLLCLVPAELRATGQCPRSVILAQVQKGGGHWVFGELGTKALGGSFWRRYIPSWDQARCVLGKRERRRRCSQREEPHAPSHRSGKLLHRG